MKKLLLILFCFLIISGCNRKPADIGDLDVSFYETYDNNELFQGLEQANIFLKEILSENETDSALRGLSFEEFESENPLYALLYPNVNQQSGQLNSGPVLGSCNIKDTAALNAYLNDDTIKKFFPADIKFAYTVKSYNTDVKFIQLVALKLNNRNSNQVDSCIIKKVKQNVDPSKFSADLSITLDSHGAKQLQIFTAKNIGKSVAIVLDGSVYSYYPIIQAEIEGKFQITGNLEEAKDIAKRINGRNVYFF